jgi:hypothetical protein
MRAHRGGDLIADGEDGVERGHRLLKDHGDPGAPHAAHGLGILGEQVLALEDDTSRRDATGRRHQPHDGQRGDALPASALAHEPEHLAPVDGEAHPVHRAEHAPGGGEVGLQAFDGEKRRHPRP